MAAALAMILQLWALCGCTVVAAGCLGFNAVQIARCMPALAVAFLVLRVFL